MNCLALRPAALALACALAAYSSRCVYKSPLWRRIVGAWLCTTATLLVRGERGVRGLNLCRQRAPKCPAPRVQSLYSASTFSS